MREYSANSNRAPEEIRSDASANRKAIILAARKLFADDKPDSSLKDIANAAGVSRATLYRNFPDKSSIIIAVFHYNLDILEAYVKRIAGQEDRFFKLMEAIIQHQVKFQALSSRVTKMDENLNERVHAIFAGPVEEAKKAGSLRPDFDIQRDLLLLLSMIGGALLMEDDTDKTTKVKRALTFVIEGVRKK